MNKLSVNMLDSANAFLRAIDMYGSVSVPCSTLAHFTLGSTSVDVVLELALKCGWIVQDSELHSCTITGNGEKIARLSSDDRHYIFRLMLFDFIRTQKPAWSFRIMLGRHETELFLDADTRACFREADLFASIPDDDVVEWWDEISASFRKDRDNHRMKVGRLGEKMSFVFERQRTCENPRWSSIDSNLLGYDIASQMGKDDRAPLFIEVKSSEQSIGNAYFHISSNEWSMALNHADAYVFHLWSITTRGSQLAIVKAHDMSMFIPQNQCDGEWESVRIPYSPFADFFNSTAE